MFVRSHVTVHVAVSGERQMAIATSERTFPGVDEHMTIQRGSRRNNLEKRERIQLLLIDVTVLTTRYEP